MINAMAEQNAAAHDVLNKILRAQLELLRETVGWYLAGDPINRDDKRLMPHEWGSLDSFDDMRNSTATAHELLDLMQRAMVGESPEALLDELRSRFLDVFFPCTIADSVEQMLGCTWEDPADDAHAPD